MKHFHSLFLLIFLFIGLMLPTTAEAREEKRQKQLEVSAAYSTTLQSSEELAFCADKPMSYLLPALPPTVTAEPTKKASPTSQVEPTQQPITPTESSLPLTSPVAKPASLDAELIFTMINDHRKSMNLPPFEKEEKLCQLAESRGPELYDEIFVNGNIHGGFNARNIPFWITENMISLPTEQAAMNWWLNSSLHRSAIEGDYKYSCGACYGNSCAQLFTSYIPK